MSGKQKKTLYRIIISTVLFIIAIILQKYALNNIKYEKIICGIIFLVPYLVIGYDVLIKSAKNIGNGQFFDENFLMSIATIGAFAISFFGENEFPEAVFVMLFYQVGELFQSYAVGKSRQSISDLMEICPDHANVFRDGKFVEVPPEEVNIDEIILVKPGEKVPLDGIICEGKTNFNTIALTGESVPRTANTNDDAISGYINIDGLIKIKVTKNFGESTVSKILELVENASSAKSKTENFITRFAKWYTPVVVFGAIILAVVPSLIDGMWLNWIKRALTFLVISCPCALVISVPLSFFGGIGGASKRGILVKGANCLEALADINTVVFDKTGTLTKGVFHVTKVFTSGNINENELLKYAAIAESYSTHPIAISIKNACKEDISGIKDIEINEISGYGIEAKYKNNIIYAGNAKLMKEKNIKYSETDQIGTHVYIAINSEFAGCIIISDELKEDSKKAIMELKENGIKTIMLTGDKAEVASAIARNIKIDEVYSELLPTDKVTNIEKIINSQAKGSVAFVGDGINDAPVLTRADVGIAMGALGSDAAIEAADVVITDDKPSKVILSIKIARKTRVIVKQNIYFALIVKFAVLILGALGIASMWAAVFADVGVAVIAILNAMRAMNTKNC